MKATQYTCVTVIRAGQTLDGCPKAMVVVPPFPESKNIGL